MNRDTTPYDILDLLRMKYNHLREVALQQSNKENEIPITISEWYILNCIFEGIKTVPEICTKLNISKQAAHKFIKGLSDKKLLESYLYKNKKMIQFTPLGESTFRNTFIVKQHIDEMIKKNLGNEAYLQLKTLLEKEWI